MNPGFLGWRYPFVMMGSCALLSAGIVAVTLKEPQRGAKEEDLKEVLSKGESLKGVSLSFGVSLSLSLSLSLAESVAVAVIYPSMRTTCSYLPH
jgi:predicted MFS family arabinose efflux permease